MSKPLWLVSYDISCSKRLRKAYLLLLANGWALQKSVFVVSASKTQRHNLVAELESILDFEEDKLLWLPFVNSENSFHKGAASSMSITFVDERLEGIVPS